MASDTTLPHLLGFCLWRSTCLFACFMALLVFLSVGRSVGRSVGSAECGLSGRNSRVLGRGGGALLFYTRPSWLTSFLQYCDWTLPASASGLRLILSRSRSMS
ncbi:hypothetical protein IWZ03DRAFT_96269 [Phyllosticta citriasiana]|uniref:Secreted protein n=1 Tax=Phyllosticta citriasiana TaxID=595635 RepID=A0ABR1KTK4_9PEZI